MSRSIGLGRSGAIGWLVVAVAGPSRQSLIPRLAPTAALVALVVLVQLRLIAGLDSEILRWLDQRRADGAAEAMNWAFRLGFAQVDAAIALGWFVLLAARRKSHAAGRAPLALFLVIGVEVGLRLVVRQPPPDGSYSLLRTVADHPVSSLLDQTDAASRQTIVASLTGLGLPSDERRSFPSGHAARSLFLALVGASHLRRREGKPPHPVSPMGSWSRPLAIASLAVAAVIGYSALYFGYHWPSDVLGGYLLALIVWQGASALGWSSHGTTGRTSPFET